MNRNSPEYYKQVAELNKATFAGKKESRKMLAKLPMPEKIKMMIQMQKEYAVIHPEYKKYIWKG